MAKKKKKKWKYKFLSEDKYAEYERLDKDSLVKKLKEQLSFLDEQRKKKKENESVKTLAEEIKEFRANWKRNDELEEAKEAYEKIKSERDTEILSELEDKKALEGGFRDAVKGAEEHRDALLYIFRFKE